jgi:predicted transcriptional regulator
MLLLSLSALCSHARLVTQAERLNMRLPPDLKRRLDRLAVTRDFEVRPLSIVARKALECGLEILEAQRAELDSE